MAESDDAPKVPSGVGSADDAGAPAAGAARHRHLHRLAGAIALGAFLVAHLLTNASALGGAARYDAIAGAVQRSSLTPLLEIVFVVIPLGLYLGVGVYLRRGGAATAKIERARDRRLRLLQRMSAVVLIAFVLVHVWELRVQRLFFGLPADALYTTQSAHLSWTWAGAPWVALFYLLGVLAAATYVATALFAATTASPSAAERAGRRRVRAATIGLGVVLFVLGGVTVIGLATGTRLLPGADGDSALPSAPCGPAASAPSPPFEPLTPSR